MSRSSRGRVSKISSHPLASLKPGSRGRIVRVGRDLTSRAERLAALGVSAGATVHVLQTFPGIVFECDQTELAVERTVARSIFVEVEGEAGGERRETEAS